SLEKLTNLSSGFFSNFPNLVEVFVNNCNLENLPENLFHGSINLKRIRIDDNSLQSLPDKLFQGLINLEELNLGKNRIESIPDNIFISCRKLQKLEIDNNNIVKISRATFNGLHSLRKLFIQHNNIITIDEEKFAIMRNITYINLSHNNIKYISKTKSKSGSKSSLNSCKNLKELDLSYNKISNFRKEWTRIPQIQRLNLSNNVLSSITTDDLDLRHNYSYSLDVSYNKIKRIHFDNCETRFPDKSKRDIKLFLNDNPIECDDTLYDLLQYLDGTMTAKVREKLLIEIGQMRCPELVNEYGGILLSEINSKDYISIPFKEGIVNYELCPKECDLRRKRSEQTFIIDCSYRNFTELPDALCYSREDSDYNKLNLTGNFIDDVTNITTIGFDKVGILDLSYNQIATLTQTLFLQNKYKMLRLNNNQLKTISLELKELIYLSVDRIKFGNNPWECDCETSHLLELIRLNLIEDTNNLICSNSNLQIKTLSFQELCPMNVDVLITLIGIVVGVIGLVLGAITIFYQRFRKKIKIWLYLHSLCLSLITEEDLDKDKIYDAFISYSHKDEEFVINELIANLESGPRPYKLCIHFRDWLAGVWIPTQIARSIQKSRRTIVVVSTNFIGSEWGRVEFRAAYKKGLSEGISRVIVVLYGDIGPIDNLEPDLKSYLKMNTYVQWGDPWFWDKLRYALPHGHGIPKGATTSSNRPHPTAQLDFNKIERTNYTDIELISMEQHENKNTQDITKNFQIKNFGIIFQKKKEIMQLIQWKIYLLLLTIKISTAFIQPPAEINEDGYRIVPVYKNTTEVTENPNFSFSSDNLILSNYKNKITALPKNFLQPFPNLKFLSLGNNNFERFAPNTFENLRQLKFLNISRNELIELPKEIFDDLESLKFCILSHNRLKVLPVGIFDKNPNLLVVSISANNFKYLPEELFKNNRQLEFVRIRFNNKLEYLPNRLFSDLKYLVRVSISFCRLKSLSENLFSGSFNLRDLRAQHNELETLPAKIFNDLIYIKVIQLDHNRIKSLPDNIFKSCINLQELYLVNNDILKISRFTFNGLESLNVLGLHNNSLTTIEEKAFTTLPSIKNIDLSENNITHFQEMKNENEVTSAFSECKNLEKLDLSHNKLSTLSSEWILIPEIKYLNLSNNYLTSLTTNDFDLEHKHNFVLDVSHNNIKEIYFTNHETEFDVEIGRNITLFLNDNPLECNDALYDLLRYLDGSMTAKVREKLFIETGTMRCSAPKEYEGIPLSQINSKDYKSMPLGEQIVNYELCPRECDLRKWHANKTFTIDCSYRNITNVPKTLCYSGEEGYNTELDLTGNFIKDLSQAPPFGYEKMRNIFLSHNQISNITLGMFSSPKLRLVTLDNNQLSSMSSEIVRHFSLSKMTATLGHNPWNCDCENNDLRKASQRPVTFIRDSDEILCQISNEPIKSYQTLCVIDTIVIIVLSTIVALLGVLFPALSIFYCFYKKKIKIWLYIHNMCLSLVTEVELDKDKVYDAFISYSHKDEEFVVNELITNLESGPRSFKLCVHFRDWPAGGWIPSQISRSIKQSRRTIFVISTNFINSEWAKMEFRAAHKKALREGRTRIIVVLFGDIGPIDHLEPDLKSYLKMNTYVKWGDPWFWDKLLYALPHRSDVVIGNTQL
ncbi:protein toll-like, partial [Leptopilina heterotoma]|uniref:protein toll-like n=1 Tax=Leptopilina heterotoma TaxID=63436 RepID=UPI001CA8B305